MSKVNGKPRLRNYNLVKKSLLTIKPKVKIFGIADSTAYRAIDQKDEFELLRNNGEIVQVTSGEEADYYLIKYAENKKNCLIITNDRFNNHNISNNLKNRIIPVVIIDDEVIFSEKLSRII